jgi:hypothetical protein
VPRRGARFRHVILPLAMPGVIAGTILSFILAMNAYATPVLLGRADVPDDGTHRLQTSSRASRTGRSVRSCICADDGDAPSDRDLQLARPTRLPALKAAPRGSRFVEKSYKCRAWSRRARSNPLDRLRKVLLARYLLQTNTSCAEDTLGGPGNRSSTGYLGRPHSGPPRTTTIRWGRSETVRISLAILSTLALSGVAYAGNTRATFPSRGSSNFSRSLPSRLSR